MNDFKNLAEFPNYDIYRNGELYNKNTNFKLCGTITKEGYRRFCIYNKDGKSKRMYLHRLLAQAFLENPNNYNQIDHIDNNTRNNNLDNLRWCNSSQNNTNRENFSYNREGVPEKKFKYVQWHKKKQKWCGQIQVNGKNIHIGYSDNDEELYIMCLDFIYSIFKDNDFYSSQIKEDLLYYKITEN